MSDSIPMLNEWEAQGLLKALARLHPPHGVVHVGVGQGEGLMHAWREGDVREALLIDLDQTPPTWIVKAMDIHEDWHYEPALVSDTPGEATCFRASNPSESGLLDPANLTRYWPNLRCLDQEDIPAKPLDAITQGRDPDWVILDCLPALRLIKGATQTLLSASVCLVRFAKGVDEAAEPHAIGLDAITDHLETLDFLPTGFWEENQPLLGCAVFVRDWQRNLVKTTSEIESAANARIAAVEAALLDLSRSKDQLLIENDSLRSQRDQLENNAREFEARMQAFSAQEGAIKAQLEGLSAEKNALTSQRDILVKEKTDLLAAKDAEVKQQEERFNALAKERDQLTGQLVERQEKIEALTQLVQADQEEKAALHSQRDTEAQAKDEATSRLALIQAEKEELAGQIVVLRQEKQATDAEKSALATARDQLASQVLECNQNIETLTEQLKTNQQEKAALQSQRDTEAHAKDEATSRLAQSQAEKEALAGQIEALSQEKQAIDAEKTALAESSAAESQRLTGLIERLTRERDQGAREAEALRQELAAAQTELDAREQALAGVIQQLEAEAGAKAEITTLLAACEKERSDVVCLKNKEIATLIEKTTQLVSSHDALEKEKTYLSVSRDEQSKTAEDAQKRIEQITQAYGEALASLNAAEARINKQNLDQAHIHEQLNTVEKENNALKTLLESRENELSDYLRRQCIINDEMLRAEAQLDLIKDVLLREPGL